MTALRTRALDRAERRAAIALGRAETPHADAHRWALTEFRKTSAWAVGQAVEAIGRFDSSAWIGDVDVPAAVVVTTKDKLIPPGRQRKLGKAIGATQFEVHAGHASCVLRAEEFVPGLLAACASVTTRA